MEQLARLDRYLEAAHFIVLLPLAPEVVLHVFEDFDVGAHGNGGSLGSS